MFVSPVVRVFIFLSFLFLGLSSFAQNVVNGIVMDEQRNPVGNVTVILGDSTKGVVTNNEGHFSIEVKSNASTIKFLHVSYYPRELQLVNLDSDTTIQVSLTKSTQVLSQVDVIGVLERDREQAGITTLEPKSAEVMPSAFNDFSKVLASLPGVISNNELSTSYSVRGGNFDENLVYVNDIPIYRPQLVSAGRQEGLSFVNTQLVEDITFSAGGWQPKYGDKLSSSLNVTYQEPEELDASASIGLLGGSLHVGNSLKNKRLNYIVGVRHKRSEYLLNSLETKGQYFPRFTDVQTYLNYDISKPSNQNKTKLGVLFSYARNRYIVIPETQETEFGTFNQAMRFYVGFIGNEYLQYDTYQGGIKLSHEFNSKMLSDLVVSVVHSREREFRDIEGGYRLCDVDNRPGSSTFNECVTIRGIGSNYQHSRNNLTIKMLNLESRNEIELNDKNTLEFGLGFGINLINDQLDEYTFRDSSDYVIQLENRYAENALVYRSYTAYVQSTSQLSAEFWASYGARMYVTDRDNQVLISPRIQLAYEPTSSRQDIIFRAAFGSYQQPAFYREMRDFEGNLDRQVQAQRSYHSIIGMDRNMIIRSRGFKLTTEAYYKYYPNIIPYDVDNVRIRYYPGRNAKGYATGIDMRLSGEFIPGTVSWFSLGILSTKEDVEGDNQEYIRRPSDQRVNVGVFFQDHLPNDPSWRVNLSMLFGSGLPFGPPGDVESRNSFNGDLYRRVDIGFVKEFNLGENKNTDLLIGLDILNLLGARNTISYTWIEDVIGNQFAIPNSLTARFLNLKLTLKY